MGIPVNDIGYRQSDKQRNHNDIPKPDNSVYYAFKIDLNPLGFSLTSALLLVIPEYLIWFQFIVR